MKSYARNMYGIMLLAVQCTLTQTCLERQWRVQRGGGLRVLEHPPPLRALAQHMTKASSGAQ